METSTRTSAGSLTLKVFAVLAFLLVVHETLWQTDTKAAPQPVVAEAQVRYHGNSTLGKKVRFRPLSSKAKVMTLADMPDLINVTQIFQNETVQSLTWDQALVGREPVVEILHRAGVKFDLDVLKILPLWSDVEALYGTEPVVLGLEQCEAFRETYPLQERFAGIVGQHNCGTNAMAKYMMNNLVIPLNTGIGKGILAQVPWHKHGWVDMRTNYMFCKPDDHEAVLPILIVRDPYTWFNSMCESPYLMKWPHDKNACPNLVKDLENDVGVHARTRWGKNERTWDSLAHVWSEFNGEYRDADFPRLVIRFEDILFHTPAVLEKIRDCVDARYKKRFFVFSPEASKQNKYFTDIKPQSSMLSAIIKYGQDHGQRLEHMTDADIEYARRHLDADLMEALNYHHPEQ